MGSALLPVFLLMVVFSAIALGAAVVVRAELMIAERFRQSAQAFHAAEAALELAIAELRPMVSWTPLLGGGMRSAFSRTPFSGSQPVPGSSPVVLCCGRESIAGRLQAETAAAAVPARRASGWQPFLWAPFDALVPQEPPTGLYVVVFVGQDEEEAGSPADGNDTVVVRAEAVDGSGLRRAVEAVIARRPVLPSGGGGGPPSAAVLGVLGWREIR